MPAFFLMALLLGADPPSPAAPSPAPPAGQPYSPFVAPASEEPKFALQAIRVPADLRVDLFAAEPHLANPVCFHIDARGRFYVAESFRIEAGVTDTRKHLYWLDDDLASRSVEDRVAMYRKWLTGVDRAFTAEHERIRLVEDRDGDLRADHATVFADGFNEIATTIGAGLLSRGGTVWYTGMPRLWQLRDEDGDGRAEARKSLHHGFGVHVGFYGHDLHGLQLGPDGRLYFSCGDLGLNVDAGGRRLMYPDTGTVLRCEPDGSGLEVFAFGLRNPQELAFNDRGDLFTCDNNSDSGDLARVVHLVESGDSGWRIGYQFISAPVSRGPWNADKLWRPRFDGQAAYIIPPIANLSDGPSGFAVDPGSSLLPARCAGRFFICDFRGASPISGVRSFALEPRGAGYEMRDADEFVWNVLATDADFGPDGALYVSDWVEGWEKTGKGRIYRFHDPSRADDPAARRTRELLAGGFAGRSTAELAELLGYGDRRVRQEAQFALVEKGPDGARALLEAARNARGLLARVHAIWGLGQLGRRDPPLLQLVLQPLLALLDDPDAEVRAQAARVLADARMAEAAPRLAALLQDPEPRARFFAAQALAKVGGPSNLEPLFRFLETNADSDPYLRHAGVMALAGTGAAPALIKATEHSSRSVRMAAVLALRRLGSTETARFLADRDPLVVIEAARAIYDEPIHHALPKLAELPLKADAPPALARRILNARFRLGTPEQALALAETAARDDLPEEHRQEALEALVEWPKPSGRDRVVGLWRPLPERPAAAAAQALGVPFASLLASPHEAVSRLAARAAARLGLREASPALYDLASGSRPAALRAAALEALEALSEPRLLEAARRAIADSEPILRAAGRRLLARGKPDEAAPVLGEALETGTAAERQDALSLLGGLPGPAPAAVIVSWLDRLAAGKVPAEIQLDLLEAASRREEPEVKARVEKLEKARPAEDPLAPYRETLSGGDAQRGRRVFNEKQEVSCLRCHKSEGEGGQVGPDLAGLGDRQGREYILEAIVMPNRQIAKGFETAVLVTRDGQIHVGVMKDEDASQVRLTTREGKLLAIPKKSIARRDTGPSAMPEDVMKFLNKRELRDLVEYLAGLKKAN